MKAYKMYYDEIDKKIKFTIFNIKNQFDFDNDPETNFADANLGHSIEELNIIKTVDQLNKKIERGDLFIYKCRDCNKYYSMSWEEKNWFESMDFNIPKRCLFCRNKRRRKKEETKNEV